uniref:FCP1 homology domain-containing protein n=3 Tax=Setaria TaxID=4554 RepID=K4A6Z4_SETIT
MDQPPARRRDRRRRRRRRGGGGNAADVVAVEGGSAAVTTTAPVTAPGAATPARRRNRRRPRRRRDRSSAGAAAADEAAAEEEKAEAPVSGSTSPLPLLRVTCRAAPWIVAAHLGDSVLQTTTESIMNSNKTRKRDFQAGNKVLKVSAADGAACSCLARHEHSVGQIEASRSKLYKRSDVRFPIDNCTAQGSDYYNKDSNFPELKSTDLSGNLDEVYQKRICTGCSSLQKSEEYKENENGASINSSSLEKKKRRKRGGKRHNRRKRSTSQDSLLPTAADNSGLMAVVSENTTSCLEPKEQRENQNQNKVAMTNLVPLDNAERSEAYGVNLNRATEKRCELGTSNLDSTFEKRSELGKSSLDYTNMERNGLQEQDVLCSSNDHNANYLSTSHFAEAYMEKLNLFFSPGRSLGFPKKKLLILDLNGLLADINDDYHNAHMADAKVRGKLVFRRPYCDDFLNFCALNFELGVWSSRKKENVASVVNIVMRDFKPRLLFCWDMSKCTFTGHKTLENMHKPLVLKELRKLWNKEEPDLPWEEGDYSASNTLLVDDSPYKALRNPPHTAIFPRSYSYLNWNDNSLGPGGDLRMYLQNLAAADDVECFVRNNPFGQPFITECDPHWNFYAQIADKGHSPLTCCA